MNRAQWYIRVAILAALLLAGWIFVKRQGGSPVPNNAEAGGDEGVKIVQFYPRDMVVTEGGKTVLCYGVSNAKSVRIDPAVDGVGPSVVRCVEVQPKRETRYTLIAEGSDGRSVSQSFIVQVAADKETLPKIAYFRIAGCTRNTQGRPVYSLTFADRNAEEVSIDPPVFRALQGSPYGTFSVSPAATTTYTLSVKGKNGHVARKELTVDVGECK